MFTKAQVMLPEDGRATVAEGFDLQADRRCCKKTAQKGPYNAVVDSLTSSSADDLSGGASLLADSIAEHLRDGQMETEQARQRSVSQLAQRQRAIQVKLDRGYEDYLEGRISESFWTRKSQEWETESATIESEIGRLSHPAPGIVATGELLHLIVQ
jgi:hypothetical protein